MEHEEEIGLESLNGLVTSELKWYVFDLIMERLKLDKIDECRYSVDKEEKDKTSFYIKDGTILVSDKDGGDLKVYENLYLAVCDFFNRVKLVIDRRRMVMIRVGYDIKSSILIKVFNGIRRNPERLSYFIQGRRIQRFFLFQ